MDKHAKAYPKGDGVQLQFEDARADVVKQLSQVENFISQKVDAIIVNPVDTASTARISKSAIEAGTESINSPNWEEEQFSCETYENPAEQPDQTADVELTI